MADRRFSFSSTDESSVPSSPRAEGFAFGKGSDKGIQQTIQNLQNEQERVQKKTFTNWMNTYLCQRHPPIKVDNLFEDVKDGTVLLSLLEVLSGEKLPMEKGTKLRRPHHLANISTALNFLERRKIKLVNINASSIADGKSSIVLGLVWTIILYFQIEETFSSVPASEGEPKKKAPLPKQNMLDWAESVLSKKYGLHIKDFGKSWTDGVAFNAMIHNIRPDLVDMDNVQKQQARINLEHAFSTAETELGIPRLLDPEDVDVDKPDEKSIMTYVAQFLKAYPGGASGVPGTNLETVEKEIKAYNNLLNWLNGEAREVLATTQEPVTDRESEFLDYIGFKTELDRREPLFSKLGEKVKSGRALRISGPEWEKLDSSWQEVDELTRLWLQKLDSSLPGKLGKLGQWLYKAEKLLKKQEEVTDEANKMVVLYAELAQEHREFFKDLNEWQQFFMQIKRAGRYEDVVMHGPEFEHMSKRLESVALGSSVRQNRLEYVHMRYKLVDSLQNLEAKLEEWTVKYGKQDFVEEMLADYLDFVDRQNVCGNLDRIYAETKKLAELYKTGGADKTEISQIDSFLEEVGGRWKKVSAEIKSVRSMLEEALATWRQYSASVDLLTVWLTEGEQVMTQSLEAKEEFFQDLAQYEEKFQAVNKAGNFLIDISKETTAVQIKQTLVLLNKRFTNLVVEFQSYLQNEVIGKAHAEYEKGVLSVNSWLNNTIDILDRVVKCIHADLKAYLLELDQCSNQVQEVENTFKTTTRTAQSLVKDSPEEVVNAMLEALNTQKDAILKLRHEIPERIKYLKTIMPNVESLETGISDLQCWLTEGEKVLSTHRLEGTAEDAYAQLEKHTNFFKETTRQKSILESKNNVFQKICTLKAEPENIDFTPAEDLMNSANERFQSIVSSAKEWERQLEALARLWRSCHKRQQQLEEWLDAAHNILQENEDDAASLIRKHKMYFDQVDKDLMSGFESVVNEILQFLNTKEQKQLSQVLSHIKKRWDHILQLAPIRLLMLEFEVPEGKFGQSVEIAEETLKQQQEQIRSNQNLKEALAKHTQIFQEGSLLVSCEQWLDQMKNLAQQLLKLDRNEQSLEERYLNHLERWKKLQILVDNTHAQLQQLPERWKEYNERLNDVNGWVQKVEELMKDLNQENLSSDEYKEKLAEFQREMRNMSKYQDAFKWLEESLGELTGQAPNADTKREIERLQEIQSRFLDFKPDVDSTLQKSNVLSKGYEYRDNVDTKLGWLDTLQKMATEQKDRDIDSLEDARACLQEHETLSNKLEMEKTKIQAEIEAGKHLQRDSNAPAFIQQSVAELERKWKDVNEMVTARHENVRDQVSDWERYESEKAEFLAYLKKAEEEIERPLEILSRESTEKDLLSKKELQNTLGNLQGSLMQIARLNSALAEGAGQERQEQLKGEVVDFENKLDDVSHHLDAKLVELKTAQDNWNEYFRRLHSFSDSLNDEEAKLKEIYENKLSSPEDQFQKLQTIVQQISESRIALENLEKEARGHTQNFRSKDTTALKSQLSSLRRQWESTCSHAKEMSNALSGNVAHWQKYQALQEQLVPWMLKAEKYCATELPKSSSLDEAKDLYQLHQTFLQGREENLPIFEEMSTEGGYLPVDQSNIREDLESLHRRWDNISVNLDNRSQYVVKMFDSWTAYGTNLDTFQDILDKIYSRTSQEPNINTSEIQVLEHELALAKALQEDIHRHEPQMNALTRLYEEVKNYASPEGLKVLKSKQDSVASGWKNASSTAEEGEKVLASALQHRKNFYGSLQDTEKWIQNMQRKLDTGSEIYSDELTGTAAKLKSMKDECKSHDQIFQNLQQEFKELVSNCSSDEAAFLSGRFDKLMQDYTQIEDLIGNREELCTKLFKYTDAQADIQAKVKELQARLSSPNIQEKEVAEIQRELERLQKSMQPWSREADALDKLMSDAKIAIKNRGTQRNIHFGSELQSLKNAFDTISHTAKQKESHLGEVAELSSKFIQTNKDLTGNLAEVQKKLNTTQITKSTFQGLKDLAKQIEDIRGDLHMYNPDYERLRDLAREVMISDPTKSAAIQQQLAQVSSGWEAVQTQLAEKQQQCAGVINTWQQYNDVKQGAAKILGDVDKLRKQELFFSGPEDVKASLDEHKKVELQLRANQPQLDHMNNKGMQLLEDLKKLSGFDPSGVKSDLDEAKLQWKTASVDVEQRRKNLEEQLACWDQVQSGMEEAGNWVKEEVNKLDDSLRHFDDVVSVASRLRAFEEEAPSFQKLMTDLNKNIKDLTELNKHKPMHSLTSAQKDLQLQFEKAASLAKQLKSKMSIFSEEQQSLQQAMSDETEWMNRLKEDLSKCDDVTGQTENLIQRYETIKHLQQELSSHQRHISALQDQSSELQGKYPSSETASLARDSTAVTKKFESLTQRADRIQNSLLGQLEQQCSEAQQQQLRWFSTAKDRVSWCADAAGDLHNLEAKLATIKEVEDSFKDGEQMRQKAINHLDAIKGVLPTSKRGELEANQKKMENDWQNLVKSMKQTKNKLETSVEQWQKYDHCVDSLSRWLKDSEAKMKSEASLKPDIASKKEQLKHLKVLDQTIQSHRAELDDLRAAAQQISQVTGDSRTISQVGLLANRYQTLTSAVKEMIGKCDQNCREHNEYLDKHKAALEWLDKAGKSLEKCSSLVGDENSLDAKLNLVKDLVSHREEGSYYFNAAIEAGERMYPNTSVEGREGIRHELRTLRERWDSFSNDLSDTERDLDGRKMQWMSFDESFDQLNKWVADMEAQCDVEHELKATLHEKKTMLQNYKARRQVVLSYQPMIDGISDKGATLSSAQVQNMLKQLNSKYNNLVKLTENCLSQAEGDVSEHQQYQDAYQQSCQWMNTARERAAVCADLSGDRETLHIRLGRLQELVESLPDGELKIKNVHQQGEKIMPRTSAQGQAVIRRELDSLSSEWDMLKASINDSQQGLAQTAKAVEVYNGSCEVLQRWLKMMEEQFKNCELKSSLQEKEIQLELLQSLQQEINSRQSQFSELQNVASQMQASDARLASSSSQLTAKYQVLRNATQDVIVRWTDYVKEHRGFQENYDRSVEWVHTLRKRLQVCEDLAGDKQDVEDRMSKLQELLVERDGRANWIHQTIDAGERLFPNTSLAGRDIIRHELRNLKDNWEALGDELIEVQHKLDMSLSHWSSYNENFEDMQRWLLTMEVKLEDVELQASLHEKKTKLQNHQILHRDILSRDHIIGKLTEGARTLAQSAPSVKVKSFVDELKHKYDMICETSKDVLDKLERSLNDHKQYQDAAQAFSNWLNSASERLEACADHSGDKLSLKSKKDRLKDLSSMIKEGENKLHEIKNLAAITSKNTSRPGQDILQRELDHLQREWDNYLAQMKSTEHYLETTMTLWDTFDAQIEQLSSWLKSMEQKVKGHELKNTFKEKKAQLEKVKKQRDEILDHRSQVEKLTDDAQVLMHASSDIRLNSQVSQLTNRYQVLVSLIKDLTTKWDKYVLQHLLYDQSIEGFKEWMTTASQRLSQYTQPLHDHTALEEKAAMIQTLYSEKDQGYLKLRMAVETGEKLYPDTGAAGRENIRGQLRAAKQDLENFMSDLNNAQQSVDSSLQQWSSYVDGQKQIERWMTESEAALRADADLKSMLQEKKRQLQTHKNLLQDILSQHRLVDSVIGKAQGVMQSSSDPQVSEFITDINSRYEKLVAEAKSLVQKMEQHVNIHQEYQDSMQSVAKWLVVMKDKQARCAETMADKHTIQSKLDRLHELIIAMPEGATKLKDCESHAQAAIDTSDQKGRQTIQLEINAVRADWEDYSAKLSSLKDTLEQVEQHWDLYESRYQKISSWLKSAEKQILEYPLQSTLEEKEEQLLKCKELLQEITGQQREVAEFTDEAQTLQHVASESRVSNLISQMTSRYQTLQASAKDLVKRCEQNVEDHKAYIARFSESASWLDKAKMLFSQSLEPGSSRGELEDKLNKVREVVRERDVGYSKLSVCMEAGEKLYPNTASNGREVVRQELRKLKLGYESMFDDLSSIQRKLEMSMLQWNSFDESFDQLEHWLRQMESQLEGQLPILSTLREKKSQLYNYKALQQDVLSYQKLIDSISDKARSLAQADKDLELATSISQTEARYKKLCLAAMERISRYQTYVNEHQRYSDLYNASVDWFNAVRKQVSRCSDASGGRQSIQNHLDQIEDILIAKTEGEPRVREVVELSRKILPHTAPEGINVITKETEALKADWEAFSAVLAKVRTNLEACLNYWKDFQDLHEHCNVWLKDLESRLVGVDLKATLSDKQAQLEKIKTFQAEVVNQQTEFSSLNNAAQELMKVTKDDHVVGQASQLITRYQTVAHNIQELCHSWERYVLDHRAYTQSFDKCRTWLAQMKQKMTSVVHTNGDKSTVQDRLDAVQTFMTEKEQGLQMFQKALNNLQVVLPNTSVSGRDILSREMHALQQEYDALCVSLTDARLQLGGTLAQWALYDDSMEQLQRRLKDLEDKVSIESALQNTLQEKQLQLDRVNVLKLNILSQQSVIGSLSEKAQDVKQTAQNSNFEAQISLVVDRYDKLMKGVNNLVEGCEKHLQHHQEYRDAYMETSDWLGAVIDKLSLCSDVQGDKHTVESQIRKVDDIASILEVGRRKLQGTQQNGNIVITETSTYGQTLINEELKLLANDFDSFETAVNDLRNTLVTLRDKWDRYEDLYEELSKWLNSTEAEMTADSGLRATLDQKITQLNKHRTTHGEVMQRQRAFDELSHQAHTLMQASPGSSVSTQLTQLNIRYSALTSSFMNLLKKHEQRVQDHMQYNQACNKCRIWLLQAKDRLSVCCDTSGDRHQIQGQLEDLQKFTAAREEGHALVRMAVTCGEKVLGDTSFEGQQVIRSELDELRREWDVLTSQMKDITQNLELCLNQWDDYSTSNKEVMKWLKDMELRLQDAQSKSDLIEKKAELQQVRSMYQDIESYEPMVESVTYKAANLAERGPENRPNVDTSDMQTRYENVKEQAKDLLSYSEQNVLHHQNYLDSCQRFASWLKAVSEQLKSLCDTKGDRAVVETKLEMAKVLMENLNEGTQHLTQAREAGEVVLPNTSDSGRVKVQQELQNMNKNFDTFRKNLAQTCGVLENCLSCWDEFEHRCQEFDAWLKEIELLLQTEPDLKSTVGEKKELWKKYQLLKEEILSHQTSLDAVNEKAQVVVKITAEANISGTIRSLTARYRKVIALVQDKTNHLEADYNTHNLYHQNHQQFTDWLRDTSRRLETVSGVSGTRGAVKTKISEIKKIHDSLNQGHAILCKVFDSCEKTVLRTSDRGIHVITSEADKAKADYEKIVAQVSQAKERLEKVAVQWDDFDNLYQELTRWMSHVEQAIRVFPDSKVDLSEKRSNLQRYKALQADIQAHRNQLNKLEEKAGQLQDDYSRSKTVELNSRYALLVKNSKDVVGQVEEQVGSYEEYRKSYDECHNWLAKTKHQFEHLDDYSGDKKTLQDRLHQLRDFKATLGHGHELLNLMTSKGERLCGGTTSLQSQDVLLKERKSLLEDWNVFVSAIDDIEHKLETSIAQLKDLDDENFAFDGWLEKTERKLKDLVQPKANLSKKRSQLQEAEDLFDDILSYKSEFNKFKARVDALSRKGKNGGVSSNIKEQSARFQALCELAENTVGKLREYVYEHRFYDEIFDRATSWIKLMRLRAQACSDSSGDWHDIQDRIEDIKDVIISMDEGLQMVNAACDQAERILPFTTHEGKKWIERQVTELTNSWEELNSDIAECSAVLEGVQQRWHEYEEFYGSLIKWLADTESSLQAPPEVIAELSGKKTQLDTFKMIMLDVENHLRLVNEFADRVANLDALCDNPEVTDSLAEIQDRYDSVVDRSKEIVELLQSGYDEQQSFSEAQQDCEKWLLEMSYRLVANNNALSSSKLEPTERQMEKHRMIMEEIEDYRLTVDSVIKQGQQLIRNNPGQPRLATQVQAQLTNLSESYSNLQSTANQIRMTGLVSYSPNAIIRYL